MKEDNIYDTLPGNIWPTIECAGVNFIKILRTNFLYEGRSGRFFYVHVTREKLPKHHFVQKICT